MSTLHIKRKTPKTVTYENLQPGDLFVWGDPETAIHLMVEVDGAHRVINLETGKHTRNLERAIDSLDSEKPTITRVYATLVETGGDSNITIVERDNELLELIARQTEAIMLLADPPTVVSGKEDISFKSLKDDVLKSALRPFTPREHLNWLHELQASFPVDSDKYEWLKQIIAGLEVQQDL